MTEVEIVDRNKIRRLPQRGHYDRETIYAILDAALICHVGFVQDGQPVVIPTLYARDADTLLLHGTPASRLIRHVAGGQPLCISVALLDGLVLAKSVFHHSVNYRSVVIFGRGRLFEDETEKLRALVRFTERVAPGRWNAARQPNDQELRATAVVAVALESASAKIRSGGPKDGEADLDLPVWAGVLPVGEVYGDPIPASYSGAALDAPTANQGEGRQS